MKRFVGFAFIAGLAMALVLPGTSSIAAEGDASSQEVTQAELAQMIINLKGLSRFVSSPATPNDLFAVLVANGIYPEGGWKENEIVTKAVLARVIVQALGKAHEIDDPSDPNAWVNWARDNGIPIDTVGEATATLSPSAEPVANFVFDAGLTTDPLKKQAKFGEPDERQFGTDVSPNLPAAPVVVVTVAEAVAVIARVAVPPPPTRVVTPDGGA